MRELVDLILLLNKEISVKIPQINKGGCGVFAFKMAKELKKLGYSPNIMIIDYGTTTFNNRKATLNRVINKERVDRDAKRNTSFVHCCVEVGGLYFDGLKVGLDLIERWDNYTFTGNYSLEEMELALRVGGWNSSYDRKKNNPKLDRIIRKSVKQAFPQSA